MLPPYGQSLALLTDLYQLTMAYGYWKEGIADQEAVFHHFFRKAPFGGAFAVAAGIQSVADWLEDLRFGDDDIAYLKELQGRDGRPLFEPGFLEYLSELAFKCDVDAVAEGTVVFPHEPLIRVRGPLLQGQLAETAILNLANFQTLIATKAARVCHVAGDDPVLEFGLRRAQGIDGGLSASRAAYIGGCAATSNVLAGKLYGIPVRGTHAHSWVLAFDSELEAFEAFARAMPNNCVFLVDTYDTLEGVENAIAVAKQMLAEGHRLTGIRLDSGDLARLSKEARARLDRAGLEDVAVVASNDLDESSIADLKRSGAAIGVWGVGTSIATGSGQSALGGVYKLAQIRDSSGRWRGTAKRSEDPAKASMPGMLQTRRYLENGRLRADLVYDELHLPEGRWQGADLDHATGEIEFTEDHAFKPLLRPLLRSGRQVQPRTEFDKLREHCQAQLKSLPSDIHGSQGNARSPVLFETGLIERRKNFLNGSHSSSN